MQHNVYGLVITVMDEEKVLEWSFTSQYSEFSLVGETVLHVSEDK